MISQTKKFVVIILLVVVLVIVIGVFANKPKEVGKFGPFAQCIKDSGAEFYGAFWCPHCQDQKAAFGNAKRLLPYIECSNADRSQTQICIDKKIEGYPTWIFKDESRLSGFVPMATLAEKTQCILPE
jgi:thiol-disulfide isomerase/thioredoxin